MQGEDGSSEARGTAARRAAELLEQRWGLRARLRPLPGYEDENFAVEAPEGRFVLRISHAGIARETLEFQNELMRRAHASLGAALPRVRESLAGAALEPWPDDPRRLARVLTWVEGEPWRASIHPGRGVPPRFHAQLGSLVARMDLALRGAPERPSPPGFVWELSNAPAVIRARLAELPDDRRRRELVEQCLRDFEAWGGASGLASLPRAAIHGDVNDLNVMIVEGEVAGLIDFGDAAHGLRAAELAITATYAMQGEHDPLAALHALASAYFAQLPLEPEERAALPLLIRLRACVSVVIAAENARKHPDAAYYQLSAEPGWRLLTQLDAAGPARVAATVDDAAHGRPFAPSDEVDALLAARARLGPNLSLAYERPLHIVAGRGAELFDERGRAYIDGVNNICHVGHGHPRVIEAAAAQWARLNTNTRYLHGSVLEYAARLAASFPAPPEGHEPLEVCFFCCSGSEANELAVRIARAATGREDVAVLEHAYHGHTQTLIELSPYKHAGPGGRGPGPHTRVLPMPDPLRAPWREPEFRAAHAKAWATAFATPAPAALMVESIMGCGGQVEFDPGYLEALFAAARAAGALCIADEVQVGFGRVGSHMWAFETQGVRPDIVTLGKPIGNGHPMAAVVTTRSIAAAFANGMEYFNSFGGNPVSAEVGQAVLAVIEDEGLMDAARIRGAQLREGLESLAQRHPAIAQVRGRGLFVGVELCRPGAHEADAALARRVVEHARGQGVLLSIDGPRHNVLKIKPPLVIREDQIRALIAAIDEGLRLGAGRGQGAN